MDKKICPIGYEQCKLACKQTTYGHCFKHEQKDNCRIPDKVSGCPACISYVEPSPEPMPLAKSGDTTETIFTPDYHTGFKVGVAKQRDADMAWHKNEVQQVRKALIEECIKTMKLVMEETSDEELDKILDPEASFVTSCEDTARADQLASDIAHLRAIGRGRRAMNRDSKPSPEPSMPLYVWKDGDFELISLEAHDQQVRKAFVAWLKEECNQHKQYSGTSPEPCSYYLQRINCPECQAHLRAMAGGDA